MNKIFQQFTEFFEKHEWSFHQYADKPVIHTQCTGKKGQWRGVAIADVDESFIGFLSLFPSRVGEHRRAACTELITRLNFGIKHGSFQMDMEDGEIRFVSSLLTSAEEVTIFELERLVFVNLTTMDDWYDTIMKVVHGEVSPKVAVSKKDLLEKKPKPKKASSQKRRFELN